MLGGKARYHQGLLLPRRTLEEEAELETCSNGAGPCGTDTQTGSSERPKELNYSLASGFNLQAILVSKSIIFCSDISVTSVKCFKLPSHFSS